MSILAAIADRKKERLAHAKRRTPLSALRDLIAAAEKPREFQKAVTREGGALRLIAELKKASPARGVIRQDFDPAAIAALYEQKPVAALSVLTEEDFFQGSLSFVGVVKQAASKPALRKDFLLDEYQLYESRACGADAVLLIAALLDRSQAGEYLHLAAALGMAVLFEVHDERELETALALGAPVIGINNRNLATLRIDLETTFRLKREIPRGTIVVSESGIRSSSDVRRLQEAGIDAMLVGTSLMEAADIGAKIDALLSGVR